MKKSELRRIIKEEIRNALESFKTTTFTRGTGFGPPVPTSTHDSDVTKYEKKVEPELKRRIKHLEAIVSMLKPGTPDYKTVLSILDHAKNELLMPSDKQMNLASSLYAKSVGLKENDNENLCITCGKKTTGDSQFCCKECEERFNELEGEHLGYGSKKKL